MMCAARYAKQHAGDAAGYYYPVGLVTGVCNYKISSFIRLYFLVDPLLEIQLCAAFLESISLRMVFTWPSDRPAGELDRVHAHGLELQHNSAK